MACLLILFTVSFAEQKNLILMKSNLSIISFMDYAFGDVSKGASLVAQLIKNPPSVWETWVGKIP